MIMIMVIFIATTIGPHSGAAVAFRAPRTESSLSFLYSPGIHQLQYQWELKNTLSTVAATATKYRTAGKHHHIHIISSHYTQQPRWVPRMGRGHHHYVEEEAENRALLLPEDEDDLQLLFQTAQRAVLPKGDGGHASRESES